MTEKEAIKEMIAHAQGRIEAAKNLLSSEFYGDSISRAYYAILDSARTVLVKERIYPKSHAGTIAKFDEVYIKTGKFPKKLSKIFKDIQRSRQEADYGLEVKFTKEDAQNALEQAKDFVTEVKRYLRTIKKIK